MYPANNTVTPISTSASTSIVGTTASAQLVNIHSIFFPKATTGMVTLYKASGSIYTGYKYPAGSIGCHIIDGVFGQGLIVSTSAADTAFVSWWQ